MSFLSTLLKVGGIAAAPFTGGMSLIPTALSAAGDVASVLGKQQAGKAQGAANQAQIQQGQDRNAISAYEAAQQAQNQAAQTDLERKAFELKSRGTNARDAMVAKLLGGFTPTSIGTPGIPQTSITGGLARTLAGNPDMVATLASLAKQSDTALNTPQPFTGGTLLTPPKLTALPDLGTSNSFLSNLANIGQIVGSVAPYLKKGTPAYGNGDYGDEAH